MAANGITKETTPVQSYQTASGVNDNNNSAPEWVKASKYLKKSSAAKKSLGVKEPVTNAPNDTIAKSASKANSTPIDTRSVQMLEAELTQINQNNLLFQQKVDERLIQLSNRDRLLEQQYRQLAQAINLLNQELITLKKTAAPLKESAQAPSDQNTPSSTFAEWAQLLENRLGPVGFKIAVPGIIILLLLLFWVIWPRNKKKKQKQANNGDTQEKGTVDDTEAEYDYMGSEEGIPAKLDLARTYIAMEDYNTARQVLAEVSQYGDHSNKLEAQAMLDEIPVES